MKMLLISILASLLLFGCTQPTTSQPYDGKINLELSQQFTSSFDGPHIFLLIKTEKIFPCSNYALNARTEVAREIIKVFLDGTSVGDICLTALGPATYSQDLQLNEGNYQLELNSNNKLDKYSISVTKTQIDLTTISTSFSYSNMTSVSRLPKDLLWAQCFYNGQVKDDPSDDFCDRFFNDIEKISIPYLDADPSKPLAQQFYKYTGGTEPLIEIISKYNRKDYYTIISTSNGRAYFCSNYIDNNFKTSLICTKPDIAIVPKVEVKYRRVAPKVTSECDNPQCWVDLAYKTKNASICEELITSYHGQFSGWKADCYNSLALATMNESYCSPPSTVFKDPVDHCFTEIAVNKSKPELCENLLNYTRDRCYQVYGMQKIDLNSCYNISNSGMQKVCIDNVNYFLKSNEKN